jgi:hypothetical protein
MAKVLVSIDDRLLERLDRAARERGLTRSALISEFAAKGLGEVKGPGADPRVHEALRKATEIVSRYSVPGDSTQWIREQRDSR